MSSMRPNPVREKLKTGGTVFGSMAFEFFTPGLSVALAQAGADFVLLDTEHSGVGIETIKVQIAAARGAGIVPMVRVPGTHYHLIAPMLDVGAMGIMVPMVETLDQAQKIAAWCRYPPDGVRGLAFGIGHDDYSGGDMATKMAEANARTLVIALIETATGIAHVDEIMAVPGIDVGWLGHYDLTATMGIPGEFEHPDFLAAVDRLVAACRRHGKTPGFLAYSLPQAKAWLAKGFRCMGYGTDLSLLQGALREGLAALRDSGA
jgi:2-keto-3-deoxy-L-rhamnonate aldolase RhmA